MSFCVGSYFVFIVSFVKEHFALLPHTLIYFAETEPLFLKKPKKKNPKRIIFHHKFLMSGAEIISHVMWSLLCSYSYNISERFHLSKAESRRKQTARG